MNINNIKYIKITFTMTNCHSTVLPSAVTLISHLSSLAYSLTLPTFPLSLSLVLFYHLSLSFCQTCVYFAYVLSLLPLRPEPRFSVVPPGGCSFVPPSSSPFWSGTGTAFSTLFVSPLPHFFLPTHF